ncbi:hypothetical protein CH373_09450 [Leptospira perolatii]|uniref:Uncharacterized protein n=2 Tax=Leptospira perolatii TaxID=2023191 RepID=A0A2M9ZME8_9LEPT|nr:hypothetical protein CH360_15950 [Leptospira perolatii]PJZ73205.1 hypothetical protein CH373_09450 [Leptospira perolatii]
MKYGNPAPVQTAEKKAILLVDDRTMPKYGFLDSRSAERKIFQLLKNEYEGTLQDPSETKQLIRAKSLESTFLALPYTDSIAIESRKTELEKIAQIFGASDLFILTISEDHMSFTSGFYAPNGSQENNGYVPGSFVGLTWIDLRSGSIYRQVAYKFPIYGFTLPSRSELYSKKLVSKIFGDWN